MLDCARAPLLATLKRYDPFLYLKWNPKKRGGKGVWELRRAPEVKSVAISVPSDRHSVKSIQGDIYDLGPYSIVVPKYHEYDIENHIKDFECLGYHILGWLDQHDTWKYGFRGKYLTKEADYNEAKYMERIDEQADADRQYMAKQHKTLINDFREFILAGGNPYRIVDHWGK